MKSVAYLEDNALQGEVTARLYQSVRKKFHGEVQFIVVSTWDEAAELVERDAPDVMVVDLVLGADHAADVTVEKIKRVWRKWPPILVLTGMGFDLELRRKCIEAGADDFMVKDDARHGCMETLVERVYHCHLRKKRDETRT